MCACCHRCNYHCPSHADEPRGCHCDPLADRPTCQPGCHHADAQPAKDPK